MTCKSLDHTPVVSHHEYWQDRRLEEKSYAPCSDVRPLPKLRTIEHTVDATQSIDINKETNVYALNYCDRARGFVGCAARGATRGIRQPQARPTYAPVTTTSRDDNLLLGALHCYRCITYLQPETYSF